MSDPHDKAFFEQMRTERRNYEKLGNILCGLAGGGSFLDLGCGVGIQTAWIARCGNFIVGADHQALQCGMVEPGFPCIDVDLTLPPADIGTFDTVICTETAEHLPEEFADNVVEHCVRRALQRIIWSAAVPGQEWPGHVNCQPVPYWLDKFAERSWFISPRETEWLRDQMLFHRAQHFGARANFVVLVP